MILRPNMSCFFFRVEGYTSDGTNDFLLSTLITGYGELLALNIKNLSCSSVSEDRLDRATSIPAIFDYSLMSECAPYKCLFPV